MSTQELRPIEEYYPSEPWLETYKDAINANDEYAENSAGWGVDFDGSFVFQIENVPVEEKTLTDLPPEIVNAVTEELLEFSEGGIEEILEDAPPEVRESIDERDGSLAQRALDEIMETPMKEVPDRTWPEFREALPDLADELITQLEENMSDDGTIYAYLDLYDGECRGVDTYTSLDDVEYGFRLIGDYEEWGKLIRGEGDVINMLMSGEFEIDGDMQKILQYSDAAVDLAEISAETESRFLF